MEFNDGSMYRVVLDPARQLAERQLYCHRAASARGNVPYVDPTFVDHRNKLSAMPGLLFYQFVYLAAGTPEAQADLLVNALGGGLRTNEMVMLDVESGGGFTASNVVPFAQRWLARVESRLHTLAWVYVPSALAAGINRAVTGSRLVMAPRYSGTGARGTAPSWSHDVHQFTDRGYFPGCGQTGDTSYTTLTVDQMLRRCNPSGIATPCGG